MGGGWRGSKDWGSEGKVVPAALSPQPASAGLNVIVLDEAVVLLFTHVRADPLPRPGQRAVLVAGPVFAAEVAFGSKSNEEREDHSPQHDPYQHRPCPGPSARSRGHG